MTDSRKTFEAWWDMNSERLIYENDPRRLTEEGWQAARRAALEEAIKACESNDDGMGGQISAAASWCADDIRALAAQTWQEGK